jgi:hypothetical protein
VDVASGEDLAARLAALEERVAQLEKPAASNTAGTPESQPLWALEGLRQRLAGSDATGAVLFTGMVNLPSGGQLVWQQGARTDRLLEQDWSDQSAPLAALGHPVRLTLLRHILNGEHTITELQRIADLGTSGQLYHHLKQLVATGWLHASGRGRYEVPGSKVIPLLTVLSAVGPTSTGDKQQDENQDN